MGDPQPLLFILGPSGSGKTTLGRWLGEDLDLLHLEMDLWGRDAIGVHSLRKEWDEFWGRADAASLVSAVGERAEAAGRRGAVLTFPSSLVLRRQHRRAAHTAGIELLVLFGTGAECLEAFRRRESAPGSELDEDYWVRHNARPYAELSRPAFAPYRVDVFKDGGFRERGDLVAEVAARLGV